MTHWLLSLELIDNPVMVIVSRIAFVVLLAFVVLARPVRFRRVAIGAVLGAVILWVTAAVLEHEGTFDGPLPRLAMLWGVCAGLGIGAGVVAVLSRPWARRLAGIVLILVSILVGMLGVNRAYGITHTFAALLGVQAYDVVPLPAATPAAGADDGADLYKTWVAPADMPAHGQVSALGGSERIPVGNFPKARDGALYLPPAALVAHPPALPLLVFMMGQPGGPDPTHLATALDAFAAAHHGLAPIAIVADQLGAPDLDPVCRDSSRYGAVSTYLNTLVPQYAQAHLNITADHSRWVIGGYSNGGACAFAFAAAHPDLWGGLLDISGNEYPGSEHVSHTVAELFGGDKAAFEAAMPTAQLAAHPGAYAGHPAVFTWGTEDPTFGPGQKRNADAARAAGFNVAAIPIAGAGHVGTALTGGIDAAIAALGPAIGLAPPG